jgi:hypothetical protein
MIHKKFAPQAILPRPWNPDCPRFQWPKVSRNSLIVKCSIEDKAIKEIKLVPVWVNNNGQPEPVSAQTQKGKEVIEFVLDSSEPFRTQLPIEGDEVLVFRG